MRPIEQRGGKLFRHALELAARLGGFAGRLSPEELMEINVALRAVLDLE
jgi:hypothetical protein